MALLQTRLLYSYVRSRLAVKSQPCSRCLGRAVVVAASELLYCSAVIRICSCILIASGSGGNWTDGAILRTLFRFGNETARGWWWWERVIQRRRSGWNSRVTTPLTLPCLSLAFQVPRVDDERLCDFPLQVQEEMSETLLRLRRSSCLPVRCLGIGQVCDNYSKLL